MGTVMALDVAMGKSYKVVYNDQSCLSEGEVIHNQTGFQELLNEIQTLPDDLMLVFESTGIYSKPIEAFCQKNQIRYCLLNPLAAKKQLEQGTLRSWKTDKHDAHKLAQVHQQNDRPEKTMKEFETKIRDHFLFLDYAPIVFLSAKTKKRIHTLLPMIDLVSDNHSMRVQTNVLNDVIMDAIAMNPTPTDSGRRLKIFYATQVSVKPPTFVLFVNDPELLHFSYERFIENQIRNAFGFVGTPIRIFARQRQ